MEPNTIQDNNNQPVQPIMPKPFDKLRAGQKKQIPSWLGFLIIAIVIVIVFGGAFAWQYFFVKLPTVVEAPQVQSPTEGWKIYTNAEYGFEFKYPNDFLAEGPVVPDEIIRINQSDYESFSISCVLSDASNNTRYPVEKILENKYESNFGKFKRETINNINVIIFDPIEEMGGGKGQNIYLLNFPSEGKYLSLYCFANPFEENSYIFRKILSTFKFTTPTASAVPSKVGECVKTSISKIETRLVDGNTGESIIGSGDAIRYSNGLYGVSYEAVPGIKNAKVGDSINLCLLSIPENCPPGDNRGKVYGATNLRTGEKWGLPDSQHFCGGA